MCLSIYIGCQHEIYNRANVKGDLGLEKASWSPPPLVNFPHVYYVGRKGSGETLECSCLLVEYVYWEENSLSIESNDLYPVNGTCPFDTLQAYVRNAAEGNRAATLVCDDSGGLAQECNDNDYDNLLITPKMIVRDNFLFADPKNTYPWRAFHVISDRTEGWRKIC